MNGDPTKAEDQKQYPTKHDGSAGAPGPSLYPSSGRPAFSLDTQTEAVFADHWFFEQYIPTWVAAGARSDTDPRSVLDYWCVPMHAANPNMNRWLTTEEEVLGLLSDNQTPLKAKHYSHTEVLDQHMTFYNDCAASIDVIWSRRRADEVQIDRRAVHFEIRSVDGGWQHLLTQPGIYLALNRVCHLFCLVCRQSP
jgi:hypothetical protein